MKKTIFVADDNVLTLEALKTSKIWEQCGYELVGAAHNGPEALEEIRVLRPDIAMLDIRMPGCTGLEVINQLRKEGSDCLFLILTAYDDFNFAREGLKLGVFDYILKPVDEEELLQVLVKASLIIEQKHLDDLTKRIEAEWERTRRLLHDSLAGSEQALEQFAGLSEIRRSAAFEGVMVQNFSRSSGSEFDLDQYLEEIRELSALLESKFHVDLMYAWNRTELFLLICYQEKMQQVDYHLTALKIVESIYDHLKKSGYDCVIGISDCKKDIMDLAEMRKEIDLALNSRYFLENQAVVHYRSIQSHSVQNEFRLAKSMQDIMQAFRTEPASVQQKAETLMNDMAASRSNIELIRNIAVQIAIHAYYTSSEKNQNILSEISGKDIITGIREQHTMQSLIQWLDEFLDKCLEPREETRNYSRATKLALDYITDHYMEHIGLADVAGYAEVSESHLCRVLKNDLGDTFISILNQVRIKAAIRLLEEGKHKVYEIADLVGFSNYAYFYQLFKKLTGHPPTEYQKGEE